MTLLDTDILTLLMKGHARVTQRVEQAEAVGITIVSRIEVLQGRFDSILKAADAKQLLLAQHWLQENEQYMNALDIVGFDDASAAEFDRHRVNKKLKVIGRRDLLIACIALAKKATLATRNLKHFRLIPGLKLENWAD